MSHVLQELAERQSVETRELASALKSPNITDSAPLSELGELLRRLPSGLVHAEAIWIMPTRPEGFVPLAEGSAWYASERALAVVLPAGRDALFRMLSDLGRYALLADKLLQRFRGQDAMLAALESEGPLEATLATELSLLLDATPLRVAKLDEDAPGLRAELASLCRAELAAVIWIHAELRPSRLRDAGRHMAESLASRTMGPAVLVISETPLLLDHLSPYVRDLGIALHAWARENAANIRTPGLVAAASDRRLSPDDVSALIAQEILRDSPATYDERRQAEASQGLLLSDLAGAVFGFADVASLAAPDPAVAVPQSAAQLYLIVGAAPETALEAARSLLETRRIRAVLFVGEARYDGASPIVAEALSSDDDAARVEGAAELVERARSLDLAVELAPDLEARPDAGASPLALGILGLVRRAKVKQLLAADAPVHAVFYPRPTAPLAQGMVALAATRLGLAALVSPESQVKTAGKSPANPATSRVLRRFRA